MNTSHVALLAHTALNIAKTGHPKNPAEGGEETHFTVFITFPYVLTVFFKKYAARRGA